MAIVLLLWRLKRHHQGQKEKKSTTPYFVKAKQLLGEKDVKEENLRMQRV